MDDLSDVTSPESRRAMLVNTLTPKTLNTDFTIPKSTPGNSSKKSAADEWSPRNFPPSLRQATYNIGCSEKQTSQVGIIIKDTESTHINDCILQGARSTSSSPVTFGNSSNFEHSKTKLLQMNSPDAMNGSMEVDESDQHTDQGGHDEKAG